MRSMFATLLVLLGTVTATGARTPERSASPAHTLPMAAPADTLHCVDAARFMRGTMHMEAIVEADVIDDWRTHQKLPGCRITAAGGSDMPITATARSFYDQLRDAKWTRTPDPVDAPNEASLRFRMGKSDCLFNVNGTPLLNTDAEVRVNDRLKINGSDTRYQVFVMCTPAMPAAPR